MGGGLKSPSRRQTFHAFQWHRNSFFPGTHYDGKPMPSFCGGRCILSGISAERKLRADGWAWFDVGVNGIAGIFLPLVIVLVLIFAVPWPRYEMAILGGFGVCAYTTMLSLLLRFQGGSRYDLLFRYGPPFGFIAATLIWLFAFIRPAISYRPAAFLVTGSPARATDPNGSTHSGQSKRHF